MSLELNEYIDMSIYLNKQFCKKILSQTLASAVKKLSEYVNIQNHKKINGKRKCFEKNKENKIIEELHALNNIIKYVTIYLELMD
jgi:hypothetical protein